MVFCSVFFNQSKWLSSPAAAAEAEVAKLGNRLARAYAVSSMHWLLPGCATTILLREGFMLKSCVLTHFEPRQ